MKQRFIGLSLGILIFTAAIVAAYSSGPPDGVTGAPGEETCAFMACHASFALNSGNGTLSITAPTEYQLNGTAIIKIDLAQDGQERWGFEATMLDTNNNFVGFFMNDDPNRTQISGNQTIEFIKHTSLGTDAGMQDAGNGWTIHWVAPSVSVGPVTLYVAGNAANNANGNSGDYIYTQSITMNPPAPGLCCVGIRGNVDNDIEDIVDISDLVYLVDFMFTDGPVPPCPEEGNVEGDIDETIDISDLVYLVDFMFTDGPLPPACP